MKHETQKHLNLIIIVRTLRYKLALCNRSGSSNTPDSRSLISECRLLEDERVKKEYLTLNCRIAGVGKADYRQAILNDVSYEKKPKEKTKFIRLAL